MKHCLDSAAKSLIEQGYIIYKRSDVKEARFTKALKHLLVHSTSRDSNAAITVKLYQLNTSRIRLSIERDEKVLYEIARRLENTRFPIAVSKDCLIRAIYISDVVKTLRDAISSVEFKGG